jgi:hypothetical protein
MAMVLLVLQNISICLVSSIPGYFLSEYLIRAGFVRRLSSKLRYMLENIIFGIVVTLIYPQTPWWLFVLITLAATILGEHKFELWHTFRRGRWWWIKGRQEDQPR